MMKPSFDLTDRVALVLGGSSGIGRSIALGYASAGAQVVPVGRRREKVRETVKAIADLGGRAAEQSADVSDLSQLDALVRTVTGQMGRIDILVNSAGAHLKKPALDVEPQEWDHVCNVNLRAPFFACQRVGRIMKGQGGGAIINIASMGSFVDVHEASVYCASKGGVAQLTRSLASEWAQYGIRVNAIAPGVFLTPLNERVLAIRERKRKIIERTPMGRFGELDELQGAAIFLASDAARFVTGTVLPVDGGFLARGV